MNQPQDQPNLFEAFVKSAQYLARLTSHQDLWQHVSKFILTYFSAGWIIVVERDSNGKLSVAYSTAPEVSTCLQDPGVEVIATDVMDSGFMAAQPIHCPEPAMTVFLPVTEKYGSGQVMIIGHKTAAPLTTELMNIYLAIAGLAGTTAERLNNERQLNKYKAHLEDMVRERTAEVGRIQIRNELILNTAGEGICGIDSSGMITFINPSAARMLSWEPAELIGRSAHTTFHHTRADGCQYTVDECPVLAALKSGKAEHSTSEEFIRRDGQRFPVEFNTNPIKENGTTVGQVMVFHDITERRLVEHKLATARDELEQQVIERTRELQMANQGLVEQVELKMKAEADLRALSLRVLSLQEEERRFIASELHDQVGQTLTVIKLMLGAVNKNASQELKPRLNDVAQQVAEVIRQVRNISQELRPTVLDDLGLVPGLKWLFDRLKEQVGLTVDFQAEPLGNLDPGVRTAVYRIVQEAVTNILRHSGVKEAAVGISIKGDVLFLRIDDHGRGFDMGEPRSSTGLSAMRERASLLGGTCDLQSAPGKGTSIEVKIPCEQTPQPH